MATYNKPGVYIQEVLSPNLPVTNISGASVGAFFGITDRGPTATVNGSVVGVPTLVSSWDEFVNTFSFGAAVKTFDASISSSTPNSNFIGTATNDLKYALYSFFSNGGSNAYILRDVNTDAAQASVQVSDTQGTASIDTSANTLTVAVVQSTSITVSSSTGTPFTSATVGNIVYFTGISTGSTNVNSLLASTNSFVISSVTNAKTIVLAYGGGVASTTVTQTTGVVTAVGVSAGNNALKIAAKDHGAWGNNLWVGIKPSQTPYYFDLSVYYGATSSLTASTATASSLDVTKNLVETNVQLSLNPTDDRYFAKVLNSNWITVTDITASSTSPNLVTRVPAFTATTQWSATAANAKAGTVGNFKWSSSSTASPNTPVRLGGWGPTITTTAATYGISGAAQSVTSVTSTTSGGTWTALPSAYFHDYATGVEGGTAVTDPTAALTQFDSVPSQLVINYPNTFDQTSINALTAYAKTRSDSFVVIDPGNYTLTTLLTSVDSMAFNTPNYGQFISLLLLLLTQRLL